MTIKTNPAEVWAEYEKAQAYNRAVKLYDTVEQNENFFIGKQWEGVQAPDLPKPTLNFIKRAGTYAISTLVTDNVGLAITPPTESAQDRQIAKILEDEVDKVVERCKIVAKNRKLLRNAYVHGKAYYYTYFDADENRIETELLENTRVMFGNPHRAELQKQPFILIAQQLLLDTVKDLVPESERDSIVPDSGEMPWENRETSSFGADRVTVLIKLWKENGTVRFLKTTKSVIIQKPTDTGYRSYPLAAMTWEEVRDSYQGMAAVTGLVHNQIETNKLWAMAIHNEELNAFPKTFYDRSRIKEWSNRVGEAIAVQGNPNEAFATSFRANDMSDHVLSIVDGTINYSKEFMGATDAALGNVRPDNTSAIIAVQKAAAAPLELQRLDFYQCIEDYVRTVLELILVHYTQRVVSAEDEMGQMREVVVDFSALNIDQLDWRVDVGASAYWSELTQIQTLDNMFAAGIVSDPEIYLENIPDEYIQNKQAVLEHVRQQKAEQMMMAQMQTGGVMQ